MHCKTWQLTESGVKYLQSVSKPDELRHSGWDGMPGGDSVAEPREREDL